MKYKVQLAVYGDHNALVSQFSKGFMEVDITHLSLIAKGLDLHKRIYHTGKIDLQHRKRHISLAKQSAEIARQQLQRFYVHQNRCKFC